ncbi:hypothetical protein Egran_04667, partial [Elaphomyces granulatus]
MVSAPTWCLVSNRFGRRTILLTGLLGSAISIILFGLSKSLTSAIIARSLGGLLNGNLPIARTYVGELAARTGADLGKVFSVFGFSLALGWIIGPLMGGTFADPAVHLGFAGPGEVFVEFPWLLPCLLSAVFNIGIFLIGYFFLDETLQREIRDTPANPHATEPLLPQCQNGDVPGRTYGGTRSADDPESPADMAHHDDGQQSSRKSQVAVLLSSAFYFTHLILFDELFSLFAASSLSRGTGLSFQPRNIATALSFAGPSMLLALFAFPWLHKRVPLLSVYRATSILFVLTYPLFSLLPKLARSSGGPVLWVVLLILMVTRYAVLAVALTSLQIVCNNIVRPQELPLFNGLAQSIGSLSRAVGPSLGGVTWSWSLSNGLPAPFDYHAS